MLAAAAVATVVAVGDMACRPGLRRTAEICHQRAVGRLAESLRPEAFLALGDLQYEHGELSAFRRSYARAFGPLDPVARPVPGNHEYETPGARGYRAYFGARARMRAHVRSFDLAGWHLVGIDSNCGDRRCAARADGRTSAATVARLRRDLAAHPGACTLAFWHHPLFSSGREEQSQSPAMRRLWRVLYAAGADVVLNGHSHDYERFDPQTPAGAPDAARGVREFVVATGGRSLLGFDTVKPNSVVRDTADYGVLRLVLRPGSYDWQFVTEAGRVADQGSAICHATSPADPGRTSELSPAPALPMEDS